MYCMTKVDWALSRPGCGRTNGKKPDVGLNSKVIKFRTDVLMRVGDVHGRLKCKVYVSGKDIVQGGKRQNAEFTAKGFNNS